MRARSRQEARRVQKQYWRDHGTSMRGMMSLHGVDPTHYLDYVHDIDYSPVEPNPALEASLRALKAWPKNGPPRDAAAWLIFTLGAILGASDTVGGEVLQMSAANFRQCLARARRATEALAGPPGQSKRPERVLLDRHREVRGGRRCRCGRLQDHR